MGFKKQIEEIQRERLNYYRAKPIGIDLTSYTYSTLPPPYQRLAGYMQIHNLVVPENWQDLETPYGHLPLADPTKGNHFTCCAPKLRDFRAFAQIDECNLLSARGLAFRPSSSCPSPRYLSLLQGPHGPLPHRWL